MLAGCLLMSCSGKLYEQTENGVIVKVQQKFPQQAQFVRLQVMGDKIIRVSATPDKRFADPQSLVVLPSQQKTSYSVSRQGDTITLSTEAIKALVKAATGEVWFTDKNGTVIL